MEIDGASYDVWSLSARRAWIEINTGRMQCSGHSVALRKESVDRNSGGFPQIIENGASLSARRAWIEMADDAIGCRIRFRRSPQGERG